VVIPLWLEHTPDLTGSLLTRQNAAALLQLLQLRHHPGLAGLLVQGQLIEAASAAGGGRVTRAKAKQQGGLQYSQVGGCNGLQRLVLSGWLRNGCCV
jgi:hypothetical protein